MSKLNNIPYQGKNQTYDLWSSMHAVSTELLFVGTFIIFSACHKIIFYQVILYVTLFYSVPNLLFSFVCHDC